VKISVEMHMNLYQSCANSVQWTILSNKHFPKSQICHTFAVSKKKTEFRIRSFHNII